MLKIYMMIGLFDEIDEDIDELVRFIFEIVGCAHSICVVLGVVFFVVKRNILLDGMLYVGIKIVNW